MGGHMNSTGWILYESADARKNSWFIEKLQNELESCRLELVYTDYIAQAYDSALYDKDMAQRMLKNRDYPEFIINRSRNADVAREFENHGVRVFNPSEVTRIGNDKDLSYSLAEKLGISYMPYIAIEGTALEPLILTDEDRSFKKTECFREISRQADEFGYPFVLKPADGHGGRHVSLINNEDDLYTALQDIMHTFRLRPYKKLLMQRPCDTVGRDLRIYMLGNEVVAAMLRNAGDSGDFRANFSLGGTASLITPTRQERFIAGELAEALPSDFIGIDMIYDKGGPVFNEIEDAVGSRMLYTYTDIDIVKMFADRIKHTLS